jgi:hypothetical protein
MATDFMAAQFKHDFLRRNHAAFLLGALGNGVRVAGQNLPRRPQGEADRIFRHLCAGCFLGNRSSAVYLP